MHQKEKIVNGTLGDPAIANRFRIYTSPTLLFLLENSPALRSCFFLSRSSRSQTKQQPKESVLPIYPSKYPTLPQKVSFRECLQQRSDIIYIYIYLSVLKTSPGLPLRPATAVTQLVVNPTTNTSLHDAVHSTTATRCHAPIDLWHSYIQLTI